MNMSAVHPNNLTGSSSWFSTLRTKNLAGSLDLGTIIFFPYVVAIVWQYLAIIPGKALAWILTAIISLALWYGYVALKETSSAALSWHFWLIVALPLLIVYALRVDFPDISLISAPAANAFSDPVTMMQRIASEASNASIAWLKSVISAALSALSAFGRLRRIRPTRSWVVMMTSSVMSWTRVTGAAGRG